MFHFTRKRVLRSFERQASEQHTCCYCDIPIFPGDWYAAEVIVYTRVKEKWLLVNKMHSSPMCPENPDDFEEERTSNVIPFRKAA